MITCKISLNCQTGFLTPFQADTVFGHLCWALAHTKGEKALEEFLQPFIDRDPPFIISDGFPDGSPADPTDGYFPKPLSVDLVAETNLLPAEAKEMKKIDLLSRDDFSRAIGGQAFAPRYEELSKQYATPHNRISRMTNTTPAEGGLYSLPEYFVSRVAIYLKVLSKETEGHFVELLRELFEEIARAGYGRKKSIGKGKFSLEGIKEVSLPEVEDANGFVTFSSFCPCETDPTEGYYRTFVKFGRLGDEFTFCGNPFKRPLVMIKTGSVFKTDGRRREFYGRMVREISPAKREVVQYAYSFPVPMRL